MDARDLTALNAHPLAVLSVCAVTIGRIELVRCWWLNVFRGARAGLACPSIFALDGVVDFLPVHRNGLWSLDAEANFVAANVNDGNHVIIAVHDAFVAVS